MTAKRPSFAVDPNVSSRAISAIMMIGMAGAVLFALSPLLRDETRSRTPVDSAKEYNASTPAKPASSVRPATTPNIRRLAFASEQQHGDSARIPHGIPEPGRGSFIDSVGTTSVLPHVDVHVPNVESDASSDESQAMDISATRSLSDDSPLNPNVPTAQPTTSRTPATPEGLTDADQRLDGPSSDAPPNIASQLAQSIIPNVPVAQAELPETLRASVEPAATNTDVHGPTQWKPRTTKATDENIQQGASTDLANQPAPDAPKELALVVAPENNQLQIQDLQVPAMPAPLLDFNTEQPIRFGEQVAQAPAVAAPKAGVAQAEAPLQSQAPAPAPAPATPGVGGNQNFQLTPPAPPTPAAPTAPAPRRNGSPLAPVDPMSSVKVANNGEITLHLDNVDIRRVLEMFSRSHSMNILVAPGVTGNVTANFEGVPVDAALQAVMDLSNLTARTHGNMLFVYPDTEIPKSDLQLRVFTLDYASAEVLLPTVVSLLTQSGKAFSSTVDPKDNLKTKEAIVVTDVTSSIDRVAEYISQIDHAPKQVLIEANVLEIELDHNERHGVNYQHFLGDFQVGLAGMANPNATSAFFAQVQGSQVNALLECLRSSNHSKTLASPRVLVVNGQTARIQVGQQLGYKVVTATQAAAVEEVRFLEVGVVLQVTPKISRDNRILMRVKPEVSNGEVNVDTSLPEEETREVETDVLLANGQGLVIGGLIQEEDVNFRQAVPYLDKVPVIGQVFRKRTDTSRRSEIIITLIPRVIDCPPGEVVIDSEEVPLSATHATPTTPQVLQHFPNSIPTTHPTSGLPRMRR